MDDLKNIAPELSKIKKENPFRAPEYYFDDFSARLQTRIATEQTAGKTKQNTIIRYLKPAIGLAAGFALIFSLAYWPMKLLTPNQLAKNTEITENTNEMLYASIVESIDENSFYTLLEDTKSARIFDDEELEDYMTSNSSDYDLYSAANIQ